MITSVNIAAVSSQRSIQSLQTEPIHIGTVVSQARPPSLSTAFSYFMKAKRC